MTTVQAEPATDYVALATGGRLKSTDPGMEDTDTRWKGHTLFHVGDPVMVLSEGGFVTGLVNETPEQNDRAIVVRCDKRVHDNFNFLGGHGLTVGVYCAPKRCFLANIRFLNPESNEQLWSYPHTDPGDQ